MGDVTGREVSIGALVLAVRSINGKIYTGAMPSRIYVQLKDISKPSIVHDGHTLRLNKKTGKCTVRDLTGEIRGVFQEDMIVGWWIEKSPVDPRNLSNQDIKRLAQEVLTLGITLGADLPPDLTTALPSVAALPSEQS